jgi:hypothetical protein
MRNFHASALAAMLAIATSSVQANELRGWEVISLSGKSFSLIDTKQIENFSFASSGLVAATFGTKGGAITAPLYYWRIEEGDLIISQKLHGKAFVVMSDPVLEGNTLIVKRNSGSLAKYEVTIR